jgi:hypothetical protein
MAFFYTEGNDCTHSPMEWLLISVALSQMQCAKTVCRLMHNIVS